MIYAVNYDLKKPGQDYAKLFEAIKGCGDWWHHLGSTWLLDTSLNAQGIWKRIEPTTDKNDFFLIIGVTRDYSGWLPEGSLGMDSNSSGKNGGLDRPSSSVRALKKRSA